jgi:hypothetical protein
MTILELIQAFCRRTNIPVPATVVGSTDAQINQALAILEEEGNDLASRHQWQGLVVEATFTTVALEDQGLLDTIAPTGFRYIRNNTIWDRTDRLKVVGRTSGVEWQEIKAGGITSPRYQFRIMGNHLLVSPIPAAGHSWAFEYVSRYWLLDTNGTTKKEFSTSDSDTFLIPASLLLSGLRWRWMREKGLDYAELFNAYEMQVKDEMGRDGGAPILSSSSRSVNPGIYVPNGNWVVP